MESKNKYDIIEETKQKLNLLADATGTLRCGLVWNINQLLDALAQMLQNEDGQHETKIAELRGLIMEKGSEENA